MLGLPCMSNVSSFSAHFLKTIAWLIVLPVHLQGCFVGTSLPLAHGSGTVVEKAERKCQGSFSKTIISVYIFVWVREMKQLVELRDKVLKHNVTRRYCHKNFKCILFRRIWHSARLEITLWVTHPMQSAWLRKFTKRNLDHGKRKKGAEGWVFQGLTNPLDKLPQICIGMSHSPVFSCHFTIPHPTSFFPFSSCSPFVILQCRLREDRLWVSLGILVRLWTTGAHSALGGFECVIPAPW